jgi:hypothetical protein
MRTLPLVAALAFAFTIFLLGGFNLPGALLIALYIAGPGRCDAKVGTRRHQARLWLTTSMLWPSGSSTNAP